MASLELSVSYWVAGDPADVSYTDDVAVQVSLKNTQYSRLGNHLCPSAVLLAGPYPLVLTSVVFCRCSAWVYISVSTAPIL